WLVPCCAKAPKSVLGDVVWRRLHYTWATGSMSRKETEMKVRAASSLFIVLSVLAFTAFAEDAKHAHQKEATKHAGLERFKQLTGDWVGKGVAGLEKGQEVRVKYKVTSAGSTVVETLFTDSDHEMLTLIHQDGDDLAPAQYCALGTQTDMKTTGVGHGAQGRLQLHSTRRC